MKYSSWRKGVNPTIVGWYQCRGNLLTSYYRETGFAWRKWTKSGWKWMNHNGHLVPAAMGYLDEWRGLANKPKDTK